MRIFEPLGFHSTSNLTGFDPPVGTPADIHGIDSLLSAAAIVYELFCDKQRSPGHFVLLPTEKAIDRFVSDLLFLSPDLPLIRLTGMDISPFTGLPANRTKIGRRLGWLYRAMQSGQRAIFVGSAEFFQQLVPPPTFFQDKVLNFRVHEELPGDFIQVLSHLGYTSNSIVEEVGQYAVKGGIVDIFSPAHDHPIRIELFGQEIESLRSFDPESQMTLDRINEVTIVPARETLYQQVDRSDFCQSLRDLAQDLSLPPQRIDDVVRQVVRGNDFNGSEFLAPLFTGPLVPISSYFPPGSTLYSIFPDEISQAWDQHIGELENSLEQNQGHALTLPLRSYYLPELTDLFSCDTRLIQLSRLHITDHQKVSGPSVEIRTAGPTDLRRYSFPMGEAAPQQRISQLIGRDRSKGKRLIIGASSETQARRIGQLLNDDNLEVRLIIEGSYHFSRLLFEQEENVSLIHILAHPLSQSIEFLDENLILLSEDSLLHKKSEHRLSSKSNHLAERVFASTDLSVNDFVVHAQHGVGIFEGLKRMEVGGVAAEFIQIRYRDNDRLYLPIYRISQIQRYAVGHFTPPIDKLGSGHWEKTKIKVKNHLKDIASELLKLYAERKATSRPTLSTIDEDYLAFEAAFPYDETPDQERAISDILNDFKREYPMDRVVCGDVGFGKTEVAMRAAFRVVQSGKQVAILAPTTVLSFQHLRTFRQRFEPWPVQIDLLNRFVPLKEQRKTLNKVVSGETDIIIGTHRLLSQDINYSQLGLVIIDEEHRFGVKQKEKLKKLRLTADCLSLSATPIPRTLNMAFLGIRDLSLITTPPTDRHPIRTFVQTWDPDHAAQAIQQELTRGGQVYFIHNRIQSIHGLYDELKERLPLVNITVAHGQMPEGELERIMVEFYEGRIDVLLCTTIVESGVDVANANTMLIHNAHTFGLSQLYQLRGRIGRSKERAYCYLLIPPQTKLDAEAQERLKIMQQHTALGSGFYISQHDLELRGAGNLLGEEQSGHIQAVGYELYLELLEESLGELQGNAAATPSVEPEINLRIPALIPDDYIPDIRVRLTVYRELAKINSEEDVSTMEDKLRDQFGKLPDEVINLLGVMLIRAVCKSLGVIDVSGASKSLTIKVSDSTPIEPMAFLDLQRRLPNKYRLASENRFRIAVRSESWADIYDELCTLRAATTSPK